MPKFLYGDNRDFLENFKILHKVALSSGTSRWLLWANSVASRRDIFNHLYPQNRWKMASAWWIPQSPLRPTIVSRVRQLSEWTRFSLSLPCFLYCEKTSQNWINSKLMVVCAKSLQSCPMLCDSTDCSLPDSSRQQYWSGSPWRSFRGSSQAKGWTCVLCLQHWQTGSLPRAGDVERYSVDTCDESHWTRHLKMGKMADFMSVNEMISYVNEK